MEFERTIYRVHERNFFYIAFGFQPYSVLSKKFIFLILCFFEIASLFFVALLLVDYKYRDKSMCLLPEYEKLKEQLFQNGEFPKDVFMNIQIVEVPPSIKIDNSINNFSNTTNFSIKQKWLEVEFTVNTPLMHLSSELRISQNFTTHYIYIDSKCYANHSWQKIVFTKFIGLENLLVNEILAVFQESNNPIVIKNPASSEVLIFKPEFNKIMKGTKGPLTYIKLTIKTLIGFFLLFNLTALYIRVTIICAPIFILMVGMKLILIYKAKLNEPISLLADSCLRNNNDINSRTSLYRAFPWVGAYLYALNFNNFNSNKHIFMTFIMFITFIYFIYLGSSAVWTLLLFDKPIPAGLNDNFYGFVALIEFASLLFIRTRSSLKYFPLMNFLIFAAFIFYVNLTSYGFYFLFFSFMAQCCNIFLGLILLFFEIPALLWNPRYHYTPSFNKPRLLYFPLFSVSSIQDIPQFWSMFYPPYDRTQFTESQMALIDRNHNLYRSALELAEIAGDVDSEERRALFDENQRNEAPSDENRIDTHQNQRGNDGNMIELSSNVSGASNLVLENNSEINFRPNQNEISLNSNVINIYSPNPEDQEALYRRLNN